MAVKRIDIDPFLELSQSIPVLDVRSPGEYNHAHIPGAYSLPLFTDEERKIVGTTYKQQSREDAIKIGLDFFGKKMSKMVEEAEEIVGRLAMTDGRNMNASSRTTANEQRSSKQVIVHCWRGGMRSAGVAWLLDLYGFDVYTLVGGYTGSGKTYVLNGLEKIGEKIIDLEGLANHKGSAFGAIGQMPQP